MKDEMISKKKIQPGDKFILEIGEKRTGLDEYEIVGTDLWVWGSLLEKLTPYERDHNAEISKKVGDDLISRQVAIDAANKIIERDTSGSNAVVNAMIAWSEYIRTLPPAQPDNRLSKIAELVEGTIDHFDLDDAMDLLYQIKDVLKMR